MQRVVLVFFVFVVVSAGLLLFVRSQTTDSQSAGSSKQSNTTAVVSENPNNSCSGDAIPELTEGPYYSANSPEKNDFSRDNAPGEPLLLTGYVYDTDCRPIQNAWIDFWQADGAGEYDNTGYRLRGHQYTDENGRYMLTTVIPGEYPGRTPHIHVKLRASDTAPVITTQLFVPDAETNSTDSIYDEALLMDVDESTDGKKASYNFIIQR
jgi:protocatechuate 3,4-dioxygenase beta subunit